MEETVKEGSHTETQQNGQSTDIQSEQGVSISKEDPKEHAQTIKELKQTIRTLSEEQKRIEQFQKNFLVPDDALTDQDIQIKNTSTVDLQEQLSHLEKTQPKQQSLSRRFLKKVASFLSF